MSTFYRALGVLRGWSALVDLEVDTDRDGQARKLVEFRRDPWKYERHLSYLQRRALLDVTDPSDPDGAT